MVKAVQSLSPELAVHMESLDIQQNFEKTEIITPRLEKKFELSPIAEEVKQGDDFRSSDEIDKRSSFNVYKASPPSK